MGKFFDAAKNIFSFEKGRARGRLSCRFEIRGSLSMPLGRLWLAGWGWQVGGAGVGGGERRDYCDCVERLRLWWLSYERGA
ncbi:MULTISPECIES: hypothetical protein [Bartonella]|uniref:hypothetical protein n=1 Tax=Bartonella TaxID=773 RepID=UPI00235DE507|nr:MULTISPECIES: hypothetical protein [Bartonella]